MGQSTIDYQCRYLPILYLLRTYLETTERHSLDPMSNATGSFRMPPNIRNEDWGSDDNNDDNDDHFDGDDRSKE